MRQARVSAMLCGIAFLLGPAAASAQAYDRAAVRMFRELDAQPNPLARYLYLEKAIPGLSAGDRVLARQMASFALSELGLYTQAVLNFPLKMRPIDGLAIPANGAWRSEDAVGAITGLAATRRIVLVNEMHHDAQTRVLPLLLLPRLRALGFSHLALEALGTDRDLARRGYPLQSSGTEYLQEPVYGEIVREALRLGFVLVPYDQIPPGADARAREAGQAKNLYERVFAGHPDARLLVLAGYAHIDRSAERLGGVATMAMHLAALTGEQPLSVDQTEFVETDMDARDAYHRIIEAFPANAAQVLVDRASNKVWSAQPRLYDVSVILPPSLSLKAFGEQEVKDAASGRYRNPGDDTKLADASLTAFNDMLRPGWVSLRGQRMPYPIDTRLCRHQTPCAIEAQFTGEAATAVPADIYTFLETTSSSRLYLRPGRYRLRAWNAQGRTLSESTITVAAH